MNALDVAELYFSLSNNSDFNEISQLLTDNTVYCSQNTGEHVGADDIIVMQKAFHDKFKGLQWKVNSVKEVKPGTILFDYDFEAETKDDEKVTSNGLEYITVENGKITRVEIKNKS